MFFVRSVQEVNRWFLAFHFKRNLDFIEWAIPGRFSHVSAFAWLEGPRVWVLIDHTPRRTGRVLIWPEQAEEHAMPPGLDAWTANCGILAANVRRREGFRVTMGFWCVTAVKDLLGTSSRALSPAGLWRDLVAEGATVVYDGKPQTSTAGPGAHSSSDAGAERARESRPG